MAHSIATATRRRRPRRESLYRHLLEAADTTLGAFDALDRRAPLPEKLRAELDCLWRGARRPLGRADASLAVGQLGPGPVAPGAALIMLLKLRLVLEQALVGGDSDRAIGRGTPRQ